MRNARTSIRRHRNIEIRYELHLLSGWPATVGLELKGEHPPSVQQDQIRDASTHAERFHNGSLDRAPFATVGRVPPREATNSANLEVILGSMAAAHDSSSARRSRLGGISMRNQAS
jgi:hypothetical protein